MRFVAIPHESRRSSVPYIDDFASVTLLTSIVCPLKPSTVSVYQFAISFDNFLQRGRGVQAIESVAHFLSALTDRTCKRGANFPHTQNYLNKLRQEMISVIGKLFGHS